MRTARRFTPRQEPAVVALNFKGGAARSRMAGGSVRTDDSFRSAGWVEAVGPVVMVPARVSRAYRIGRWSSPAATVELVTGNIDTCSRCCVGFVAVSWSASAMGRPRPSTS